MMKHNFSQYFAYFLHTLHTLHFGAADIFSVALDDEMRMLEVLYHGPLKEWDRQIIIHECQRSCLICGMKEVILR